MVSHLRAPPSGTTFLPLKCGNYYTDTTSNRLLSLQVWDNLQQRICQRKSVSLEKRMLLQENSPPLQAHFLKIILAKNKYHYCIIHDTRRMCFRDNHSLVKLTICLEHFIFNTLTTSQAITEEHFENDFWQRSQARQRD